ncbi:MAG: nicotinate (nicotinamide) nucleotide adenylyltransferase [Planctomycetota bacterium]|jgi:nicotinate-nucleotide adenylyltransferase|nr:nicotinate (nicotinamide) nucleotide adenylyltransferase [Planctomycetota bacterium]MDA1024827.1 nicotinate (nicotinamide) nucleotide adenylyltransferase [Planctomycetota bacterium]
MTTPEPRVSTTNLIFLTPLVHERKILASTGIPADRLHVCGPGREGVRRWADGHSEHSGPVILVGIAGGLEPDLASGSIVVVDEVVDQRGRVTVPPAACRIDLPGSRRGRVTTTGRVVASSEAKHALGRATGASIVDLESVHFAELADSRGWDWGIIRVVGDPMEEAVPAALDRFVDHLGRTRIVVVAIELFQRPALFKRLRALGRQTRVALLALGDSLRELVLPPFDGPKIGDVRIRSVRKPGAGSILIFGGSFDPPHRGHLTLPFEAAARLGCDEVVFVPARVNPLKQETPPADPADRIRMLEAAIEHRKPDPRSPVITARIDRREVDREGPSFTIDTLEAIQRELLEKAGRDENVARQQPQLRLLIGSDQALDFDRWRDWQKIIALAPPVVMPRPPETRTSLAAKYRAHFDSNLASRWSTWTLDLAAEGVSSTEIRRRLADGEDVSALLPEGVLKVITDRGLYRKNP